MPGQQGPTPSGPDDLWAWLQSLQQNQGAAQPYGAGGAPLYGTLPGGTMPGGQVMGRTATTPGAPSMGYPAMGPPGASSAPQPAPTPLFSSVGMNPHGDGPPDVMSPEAMAAAQANPPQGGPYVGGQGVAPGIGAYPDSTNYPHSLTPPGSPSATPRPADSNAKGPLASPDASAAKPMKRRAGAPNLGYYQPNIGYYQPNNRFVGIDAPNASPQNSMRGGPQGTALNLAGLFGGRGQGAANPNVPAANAQPVSASAPAGQSNAPLDYGPLQQGNSIWDMLSKAPWNYGPLQQGNIWRIPSGGSTT